MTNPEAISIQFLGAAGTVTGSKHLLKTPAGNYMIDCGLYQGLKTLRQKNWEDLSIEFNKLKAVLLTHAHLDHCGHLPLLYKQGFRGKIYCTAPTRDLTEVILRDSAKIQEEDAAFANTKGFSKHKPSVPLYTTDLVEKTLPLFEVIDPNKNIHLNSQLSVIFRPNGHILGSTYIEAHCYGRTIVFSGDLGRPVSPLLNTPSPLVECDYLVMESTYGDRIHSANSTMDEMAEVINETIRQKGNVLIPSFAVGRAQELMHIVNELKIANRIPDVPVIMDSPMGANATEIFSKYPDWHKLSSEQSNSIFNKVQIITRLQDTFDVMSSPGSKIVIAASGMLTGGRVLFYLEKYLENRRNTILFAGYQSEGTRGRALQDGVHELRMHGSYYPVRAQVKTLSAMSGHADQAEMIIWLSGIKQKPKEVFLVHGENGAREGFRVKLESSLGWKVRVPISPEEIELV